MPAGRKFHGSYPAPSDEVAALSELIRLRGHAVLHKPVSIEVDPAACVFRQRWLQLQNVHQSVRPFLQVGVTRHLIVLNKAAECLLAQQRTREKGAGENVMFHRNR